MEFQVEVEFKGDILKGILINETDDFYVVKLSSGYNANLDKNNCKILKKEKIELNNSSKIKEVKVNKGLPKVSILHTGGTIASKVDYRTGAVLWQFSPEELLNLFPELNEIAFVDAKMIRNMASDDMRFDHYNIMLDEIKKAIEQGSQGVIITHGTDTMHYTAMALQYACEKLPVPVLLVGAQRSSDRASSDAYTNLNAAVKFILENSKQEKKYNRVGICMHETISDDSFVILDSINSKKLHSSRRDAFTSINYNFAARINDGVEILRDELFIEKENNLKFTKYDPNLKIGFMKIHTNMFAEEFSCYKNFDALIIEGTGLGHIPITKIDEFTDEHPKILDEIKDLIKNDVKLIVGTQTIYGMVDRNVYSPGRILEDVGVYGNYMNLSTESMFVRAAHILSKNKDKFEELWIKNLEGFEIRSEEN